MKHVNNASYFMLVAPGGQGRAAPREMLTRRSASSVEQAITKHDGQGAAARDRRSQLFAFLSSL